MGTEWALSGHWVGTEWALSGHWVGTEVTESCFQFVSFDYLHVLYHSLFVIVLPDIIYRLKLPHNSRLQLQYIPARNTEEFSIQSLVSLHTRQTELVTARQPPPVNHLLHSFQAVAAWFSFRSSVGQIFGHLIVLRLRLSIQTEQVSEVYQLSAIIPKQF